MPTHAPAKESANHASRPFFGSQPARAPSFFSPSAAPIARQERQEAGEESELRGESVVQTKLTVGAAGDPLEREADMVADRVVQRMAARVSSHERTPSVQAKCAACQDEEELQRQAVPDNAGEFVQAKADESPGAVPDSVEQGLAGSRGGGEALSPSLRQDMEDAFESDFSGVRVHTGPSAAGLNHDLKARAFTSGSDIYFNSAEFRPDTQGGRHLLAHELTHVLQQGASGRAPAVQRAPGGPRSREPFKKVLDLHDKSVTALGGLVKMLNGLPNPTAPLKKRIDAITALEKQAQQTKLGATQVVDAYADGKEIPVTAPVDALNYVFDDKPSKRGLERLETMETNRLALIDLAAPRVTDLSAKAEALGGDTPAEMREAFHTVAGYYLDAIPRADSTTIFDSLLFLDTYYQDPRLIQSYGLWAHIRAQLPALYENLLLAAVAGKRSFVLNKELKARDPRFERTEMQDWYKGDRQDKRAAEIALTVNLLRDFKQSEENVGVLPASLDDVPAKLPSVEHLGENAAALFAAQVRVAVLRLWQPIEPLWSLLLSHEYAGTSILPFTANDRKRWSQELTDLEIEFVDELDKLDHPGIDTKIEGWAARLQKLVDEIPPEVRRKKIISAIAQQLPFMFVAGATAAKIGLWVRAASQSKWLVAFAEGATMTLFTAGTTPLDAPNRPQGALGWAGNLAINVLLSRVGRAFFAAGDSAAKVAFSRSFIGSFGARVVIPGAGLSALQTGVQMIEAKIHGKGGETGFTELMTINLVLNGIGMVIGIATQLPERPPTAPATGTGTSALVKPAPAELAKRLGTSEDNATLLLELADRVADFQKDVAALNEAVSKGLGSKTQFEAMRKKGIDLADFLEVRLGPLSKAGLFGKATPTDVKTYLAEVRARLGALTWEGLGNVRALLPEATTGLARVGESPQWVYDRGNPPKGLAALKADFVKRGNTVKALPSGGWEATDPKGLLLAQVIPASAQTVQAAAKNLTDVASGPLAQQGLSKVRSQSAVPTGLLEAQLQAAIGTPGGEKSVPRVLQHLARFIEPTNAQAWNGLSNYLSSGGDPALLARAMAYGQPKAFEAESKMLANALLGQMSDWNPVHFAGFQALYRARPNLTAERMLSLLTDFTPEQVRGILDSIFILEPRSQGLGKVIGPLTSGAEMSQRGAMGALTSAIQLAERFPTAKLVFEAEITNAAGDVTRVVDISVVEKQTTTVAGVSKSTEVEIGAFEIKEVSTSSLGKRAPQELARDIARDSALRAGRLTPAGASRPFFETFTWRIRGAEIRQQAIDALRNPAATEAQINTKMREIVAKSLEKAFDRPEFKALSAPEQDGYRKAFAGVPFVEFF